MVTTIRNLVVALALMLLTLEMFAVEHPGVVPERAVCLSCHADKAKGRSVHAAMELPCSVCHTTARQDDLLTVALATPKDQICSGCHLQGARATWHVPALVKGQCVDCHDPHSSRRRMLLRVDNKRGSGR